MHKSGFVSIIGKPNVGKSSLINFILNKKIAITTHKPHTTRNEIRGILNTGDSQIVFIDTPGFHKSINALSDYMNTIVTRNLKEQDFVLFLTQSNIDFNNEELEIIEKIKKVKNVILIFTKIDLKQDDDFIDKKIKYIEDNKIDIIKRFSISTTENVGVEDLKNYLLNSLDEGPAYYPKDNFSDKDTLFNIQEIIREQSILLLSQEIPYSIAVKADDELSDIERGLIYIKIIVEKESQKGIVVGKKGSMIKKIGTKSRKIIEQYLGKKVHLEIRVKVEKKWRDDLTRIKRLGYSF